MLGNDDSCNMEDKLVCIDGPIEVTNQAETKTISK